MQPKRQPGRRSSAHRLAKIPPRRAAALLAALAGLAAQAGAYTVTVANGTANGAASGNYSQGAVITLVANPAPAGQWFQNWAGNATLDSATSTTTTFRMPAANVSLSALYFTPAPIPQPVATHPRMWVTQGDIARLRSWAVPTNDVYQKGLRETLNTAIKAHQWCFPNSQPGSPGQPASPYPDKGDIYGYSGSNLTGNSPANYDLVSEHHALILAFFALIDPDPDARATYAGYARDLLMVEMNLAKLGHAAGQPFRDPYFAVRERQNGIGEALPLVVDWLQGVTDANGQPVEILTAQDKATIRQVFMLWAEDILHATVPDITGHPEPVGVMNSTALLPGGKARRIATNNFYENHARLITMMPLALDPADDPPLDAAKPEAILGNTLRSYLADATGAWLYQQYSMLGEPAAVRAAYPGLPADSDVGLASGGIAPEGGYYSHAVAYTLGQLFALQTAGYNDPAISGPQIALIGAPVWDRYIKSFLSAMVPAAQVPASLAYLGPVYQFANLGDCTRLWISPDFMLNFAFIALNEQSRGVATHLQAARWLALNGVEGGAAKLLSRVQNPYGTSESIAYFLLFDPTDSAALTPADPRPGYALDFYDSGMGRLLSRTDWGPQAGMFTFRSGWLTINHQNCDAGQLELYRKGEWLTKELKTTTIRTSASPASGTTPSHCKTGAPPTPPPSPSSKQG